MDLSMKGAQMPADYMNKSSVAVETARTNSVDTKKVPSQQVSSAQQTSVPAKEQIVQVKAPTKTTENKESTVSSEQRIEQRMPEESEIAREIAEANRRLMFSDRSFQYRMEDVTKRVVITVIDNETKEVIKEIPPEKQVDALRKMWELTGLIVDKKI